jgi:hypothetical protein
MWISGHPDRQIVLPETRLSSVHSRKNYVVQYVLELKLDGIRRAESHLFIPIIMYPPRSQKRAKIKRFPFFCCCSQNWRLGTMVAWNGWIVLLFLCCATVPSTRAWLPRLELSRAPNSRRTSHRSSSHRSQQLFLAYYYSTHCRISSRLEAATTESSALSTTRLPLTRIFNGGREYLFTTRRNVRNFEWSTPELEDLFESISCLDGVNDELELNAITILPAEISEEEQMAIGITSRIYDVSFVWAFCLILLMQAVCFLKTKSRRFDTCNTIRSTMGNND